MAKPFKGMCDGGCDNIREQMVAKLPTGGGSNVYLCRKHWATEMKWRKERNLSLEPRNRYAILPWPGYASKAKVAKPKPAAAKTTRVRRLL